MKAADLRPQMPSAGLYAITASQSTAGRALSIEVRSAIQGGARIIQYRRKLASRAQAKAEIESLRSTCREAGALLIVNDDLELALETGADGVHLGREDGDWENFARDARRSLLLGISCYNEVGRAVHAAASGADYVAFGSFFPSQSKPDARQCSLETLQEARKVLRVPIVAIGGVTPENGGTLLDAGADFLAVISGVFNQASVECAAARYAALFGDRNV